MKYQTKPIQIEAEPYKEGMEDGWIVLFSGNFFDYDKYFETKQEALDFINNDLGKNEVDVNDKDYKIIYEDPIPFIKTKDGNEDIFTDDYITTRVKGDKYPCRKEEFENVYELVNSDTKQLDLDDFKIALKNWFWMLDEYNDYNNEEFNNILSKYNLTLEDIL